MTRIRRKSQAWALLALFSMLCMPAATTYAQEQLTWPVESPLMAKDWIVNTPDAWMKVGKVSMFNSRDSLTIDIVPYDTYRIANVNIHIVQNPDDFEAVFDKKAGKPKVSRFDYKADYLTDQGILVETHHQVISFEDFDKVCWGFNTEQCPPFYAIVQANLQIQQDGVWVPVPEDAYAGNGGVFDRFDKGEDLLWALYVTYPLAKAEPGHFVDANVNGLAYATVTQSGITGENGQFWFLPNERIGFSVGRLYLGDAAADREVSPPDLFGVFELEDDRVLNMARLLQSLDADGMPGHGAINISEPVVACLDSALDALYGTTLPQPAAFFADDGAVGDLIDQTVAACAGAVALTAVSKEEALENLNYGMQAGNIMKRNVSKTPDMKSDKAKIEIAPVYVPAQRADGTPTEVVYHDADGNVIETRLVAKPIVVTYEDIVEGTGVADVFVSISRDDGDTWKRTNVSKTAKRSSLIGYPGKSEKPMLKVKDNLIFVAWVDKYCRGGRPGYAITVCDELDLDTDGDGVLDNCNVCRDTADGTICTPDYQGDDAFWQDDRFGVAGPQRSVLYEDEPEVGEVPYSCVWATRGVIEIATGDIQWFKPERITSGRRDAFQLFAHAADDVAFGIVWQEDPKGLMPGEGDGPGEGWSGANTHSKTDIWYSYIGMDAFALVDDGYPIGGFGDGDFVDTDSELTGRVKALVPMSLPVKISDNDVCSYENIVALGGGEHNDDEEGEGTHRYCGTLEGIGTAEAPGTNPLCAYTVDKYNPKGELHHVCVTGDGRLLDGNTGASRPNLFMQPYKKADSSKGAYVVIGYEESKGVGSPPEDEEGCGDETVDPVDVDHDDRYKPDVGKNVIYHAFEFDKPEIVSGGGIVNLPETDEYGNPVYLVDEFGDLLLDWKGEPQLAYENARRVRFLAQPKSKAGPSRTVLVALYRQGAEGSGKPADIFMRRLVAPSTGNPYAFKGFVPGAQNLSSVKPERLWQNPLDDDAPVKMLRWSWTHSNLADSSAMNPYTDARAHRGALSGDELLIGYTWTPNWGRKANDKYDFYVRRSFNGGQTWTTDPDESAPLTTHNVVFREPVLDEDGLPILDEVSGHVIWAEIVESTTYAAGQSEPPRNLSNLRNFRTSVLEPRLVKTPGTIVNPDGTSTGYPEDLQDLSIYQVAWGLEFNQNASPSDVTYPKQPLDIYYGRTLDKGQRFEGVLVTPQGGSGQSEEGSNLLARDHPEQGAAQIRQTPDGSRLYGIWLEESDQGSDIMFRRVDYRD